MSVDEYLVQFCALRYGMGRSQLRAAAPRPNDRESSHSYALAQPRFHPLSKPRSSLAEASGSSATSAIAFQVRS